MFHSRKENAYGEREMILGGRVGRQISGAIDGSRLFAELKTTESDLARHAVERAEAATQSEAIAEIGKLLSSTLDSEEVYQPFVDEVRKLIDCDVLAINLVEADRKMIRVIHQVGRQRDDRLVGSSLVLAGSITEAAATAGRPVIVQGYSEAEMAERFPLTLPSYRMGAKSWMCTPMINRGQTIGGLVFIPNVKSAFSQSDADLAQRVGDQIAGAIANSQFLADLKQAEANLEVSYQRYQMILETAHGAFVAIDDRGQVITWNTRAEKTFGWKSGDAVRRRFSDLIIPHRFADQYMAGLRRFLDTGKGNVVNQRLELVAMHRDGHEFPVEITISPLKLGESYMFNAFVRDITEQKRLEQEVLQYTETLERANQELQQFDRLKDEFISTVSHELRTPLTSIKDSAEILLNYEDEDQELQMDFLRIINSESDRLTRLTTCWTCHGWSPDRCAGTGKNWSWPTLCSSPSMAPRPSPFKRAWRSPWTWGMTCPISGTTETDWSRW
tara:strand:- start:17430 stop:18932 length:1503 start_codon:yes stop_codon:yes gene_type:complete